MFKNYNHENKLLFIYLNRFHHVHKIMVVFHSKHFPYSIVEELYPFPIKKNHGARQNIFDQKMKSLEIFSFLMNQVKKR